MNENKTKINRALISVSNKSGIETLARGLSQLGIEIISTGGTSKLLREAKIPVTDVSEVTGFPEIMDGRLKTLHPKIHGGILGLRDEHQEIAKKHGISWIDLVVVNLYPFRETIQKSQVTFDEVIENIDIGGPTMLRAAAKNMGWVGVMVDPEDYAAVLAELQQTRELNFATRKKLAGKAFAHTAQYDGMISNYLSEAIFPEQLNLNYQKKNSLRYGENPHQAACVYVNENSTGILTAEQKQGKELSYNNLLDADAAAQALQEFSDPACVIVKHANPCGVAVGEKIADAFERAFHADAQSAFGGIVALNRECNKEVAEAIAKIFIEVLIAPSYSDEALAMLAHKQNLRVLALPPQQKNKSHVELKFIAGGVLAQEQNNAVISEENLTMVTRRKPSEKEMRDLFFAWRVVKHVKSNAILIAKNQTTVGVGAGQVSRVDAVAIAIRKAGTNLENAVLASDAFFPFRDSIDHIAKTGIRAIIQPGGSVRDEEVIAACDENDIAMIFTGQRCFKH